MLAKLPSYIVRDGLHRDAGRVHRHDEHADAGVRGLGVAVGARGQEHVLAPVGGGPDLLAVDHPVRRRRAPRWCAAPPGREPAFGSL